MSKSTSNRQGTVLLIVLIVIVLVSLGAYTFSEIMMTEHVAADAYGRRVQSRVYAESAIELVAAHLESEDSDVVPNYYHNPEAYHAVMMRDSVNARGRGRYSIVSSVENNAGTGAIRFGLVNESSRLNLNSLVADGMSEEAARERLMFIPGMTEDIADSILDWIDADDIARPYGAESEYYAGFGYQARNAPLDSLDELLMVKDMSPDLLYGEDVNRNGLLDPNENDGEASLPLDNQDGVLQVGWNEYFTVYSRESNLRADGSPKVNVNSGILTDVYDMLEEELGTDEATFIVAFRLVGPVDDGSNDETELEIDSIDDLSSMSDEELMAMAEGQLTPEQQEQLQKVAEQMGQSLFRASQQSTGDPEQDVANLVTRNGMDLSGGAKVEIASLYDLVDAQVEIEQEGQMVTLDSPFTSDAASMQAYLPILTEALSTSDDEELVGRIDVNQSRWETLRSVPGMTDALCDSIQNSTLIGDDGTPQVDAMNRRGTNGWLFMEGLVGIGDMRKLDKYVTTTGDVWRGQVVGHFDEGGPSTRLEFVIDRSVYPAQTIAVRDLSDLGRGYPNALLVPMTSR